MSARSEAAELIKQRVCPNDVAKRLGKTDRIAELKRLLLTSVGEGELLLSEIFFSIPEARRKHLENVLSAGMPEMDAVQLRLRSLTLRLHPKDRDRKTPVLGFDHGNIECDLYLLSKDSPYTETYRFLRELETTLYRLIRKTLDLRYYPPEIAWWDKGVPEKIRSRCEDVQKRNPQDDLGPWCYMNFIDFKEIIDSNWDEFCKVVPSDIVNERKKKQLLSALQRANGIRNGVMHPIKGIPLSQDDCEFVRKLAGQLLESRWRPPVRDGRFGSN